ncbi:PD-(D/E)XK nuclease family protein [uncultured Brachyspira sp.]|uniref:PD-(D/E)XK nuclease family protein n=1 Tax=uncultured Brachyspira sp. TaxID=221953 RepID=UPI0026070AD6|nr:PD-(D/E)XK nuclease family protein [uncultured Brachyspira sp.]
MNENSCINFLSNFIFYYSQYKNNLLKYLKDFILEKENIINEIDKEKEKLAPKINIINLLEASRIEVPNSFLLFNLFNTSFRENNIEINFAKIFSKYIIEDLCENKKIKNIDDIKVYKEFTIPKGRIDILIQSTNFEIIIENKIGADDGDGQLKLYYDNRKTQIDENKIFIVYLTPDGKIPSNKSIDDELREQLKNRICYLSHNDIAIWIDNILKEYKFLKENDKYQSIYSSLIQIRDNEKIISNSTEEDYMEKAVIREFVEKILSNNKDIDITKLSNIKEMKNLFENAALVFDDYKKEFYENIVNELRNNYEIGHESKYEKILENNNWYFRIDINTDLFLYINLLKEKYNIQYRTEKDTSKDKTFMKLCEIFVELKPIKNWDNWYISKSNNIIFYNENKSYKEIADEIRKIVQKLENAIK